MSKPLAATIYEEQLISPTEGFPLWEPSPGSNQLAVEIADVGYVSSRGWIRLFNASKPFGDPSNDLGVPDGYQQLIVGTVQERTSLPAKVPIFSETVEQRGLETALIGAPGAPFQVGGGFSFKCSKEHGAVLILGDDAERRDALRKQAFARLIVEQSKNWLTFANDIHERGITLDELVLVTGCDKTSSWACAAFSRESTEASICFSAGQAGVLEANISMSWIWSNCSSVAMRSGPARLPTQQHTASIHDVGGGGAVDTNHMQTTVSATSESRPLIRDQCVFLRGYKILDRKTFKLRNRLKLFVKKKGYDGFDYLYKNNVHTHGPDAGPSRRLDFHSGQGSSHGSSAMDGSSHNLGEQDPVEQDGSSPGTSDPYDSELSNSGSDDSLPLTTVLNQPKNSNHLDVILQYILKNSLAELALAHHDDLSYLLQFFGSATDFAERVNDNSPKIFIVNGVGMLEKTHSINTSSFATIDDGRRMDIDFPRGLVDHKASPSHSVPEFIPLRPCSSTLMEPTLHRINPRALTAALILPVASSFSRSYSPGDDSDGSYYPPNQPSTAYDHSSPSLPEQVATQSLTCRPSPSHFAPGGTSGRLRIPNSNDAYYPPNQPPSSYYASSSHHSRDSPAPGGSSGISYPHQAHGHAQNSSRTPAPNAYKEILHTWTQQGQITASEDLNDYIITVMLQDGRHAYQCGRPECKREGTFTSRSTVVAHIRTVHLQERPFICTTCGTTFGRKQDAERHVQSKNRGKVYQCQYCFETFSRKEYLSGVHEICCSARPASHA